MYRVLLLVVVVGCSNGSECERFVDKLSPVMSTFGDKAFTGDARTKFIAECERPDARMKKDPVFKCVLNASDSDAVTACMKSGLGEYKKKARRSEAKVQLIKLSKQLKIHYFEKGSFPVGKAGPVPAQPCCQAQGGRCSPDPQLWTGVWQAMEFEVDHTFMFQYTYESDGKTATATAVGDLDCDGDKSAYKLELTVEDGNPTSTLVEPDRRAD